MHTRMKRLGCSVVAALAFAAFGARADAYALDRFKGGGSDGYASAATCRDASVLASFVRFYGGSCDGYDILTLLGLDIPTRGLLIKIY